MRPTLEVVSTEDTIRRREAARARVDEAYRRLSVARRQEKVAEVTALLACLVLLALGCLIAWGWPS